MWALVFSVGLHWLSLLQTVNTKGKQALPVDARGWACILVIDNLFAMRNAQQLHCLEGVACCSMLRAHHSVPQTYNSSRQVRHLTSIAAL
jgi:hypothetical protein